MSTKSTKELIHIYEQTVQDDFLEGPALDTFDRYDCIWQII
jgi:hypothetical protein